ncbi:MAG: FecR family protein [Cyanobacteria bacterium P01_D01_bin.36]
MLKVRRSLFLSLLFGLAAGVPAARSQSRTIRGDRWLTITELNGYVEILPFQGSRRQARQGDRLSSVGDVLITGADASVRLEVDLATGFVSMAENSQLQIRTLSVTNTGARITQLFVLQGQVRLRIRPLTNPNTRIEIYTPAGVSGVRGTEFGVSVGPEGQTGVATLEGSVFSSAQGQTVMVEALQQSVIFPGEPPTPPAPLRDDPDLFIEVLEPLSGQQDESGRTLVQVVGYTDLVNILEVDNKPQELSREGRFDVNVSLPENRRIPVTVTTPLGTNQQYELVVP